MAFIWKVCRRPPAAMMKRKMLKRSYLAAGIKRRPIKGNKAFYYLITKMREIKNAHLRIGAKHAVVVTL